ncbi:hypothetical protein ACOME3_008293 [Neoechinorhynchus agilis]
MSNDHLRVPERISPDLTKSAFHSFNSILFIAQITIKNNAIMRTQSTWFQFLSNKRVRHNCFIVFKELTLYTHCGHFCSLHGRRSICGATCADRYLVQIIYITFSRHKDELEKLDETVKASLDKILNTQLQDETWRQASLSVSSAGLGIRKTADISLSACLGSQEASRKIVQCALGENYTLDFGVEIHTASRSPSMVANNQFGTHPW